MRATLRATLQLNFRVAAEKIGTVLADVLSETGIDFKNGDVNLEVLAPQIAARIGPAGPALDALKTVRSMMSAMASLATMSTLGAIGAVAAAGAAAVAALNGQVNKSYSESVRRSIAARENFVAEHFKPGDWSRAVSADGPAPENLELKGPVSQYAPYVVWKLDRAAGKDRLVNTWSTPPYDDASVAPDQWDEIRGNMPRLTPLTGFQTIKGPAIVPRPFWESPPPLAVIPEKYRQNYWGTEALWENRYDTAISQTGFAPPPDYLWCFSWGTYPYLSWQTASNNNPLRPRYDLSAAAAAINTAIHSVTPLHAAINAEDVAQCYRAWCTTVRLRELPLRPPGQFDSGVYLDADLLPWSPSALDQIWTVVPTSGTSNNEPWSPKNPGGMVGGHPRPEGWGYGVMLTVNVVRDIEEAFRSFFALRRAALFQLDLASPAFRKAAMANPDPAMQAALKATPEYAPWHRADPLGDGWISPSSPKRTPRPSPKPGQSGPSGLAGPGSERMEGAIWLAGGLAVGVGAELLRRARG